MNSTCACHLCKRAIGVIAYYNSTRICDRCASILMEISSFDPKKLSQPNVHNDSYPQGGES